jgi:para-nitrobenzyl esterase
MKTPSRLKAILLAIPLLTLAFGAVSDTECSEWDGNEVVTTEYGDVKGFEDDSNTWVWKAIPFARPPVGELRWKAAQNPDAWSGIREETEFCNICPQFLLGENLAGMDQTVTTVQVVGNEDCLYLNIWRPQSEETHLPVYLWIHGGGNSVGTASDDQFYPGDILANKSNLVVVTIQYRLGPLGWFTHPALRNNGNSLDDSGNYGTLDMIKALEWVRDNISAFGGDPNNVTIAGESAGAIDVLSLMISPLASGLFHRGIAQSGILLPVSVAEGDSYANSVIETLLVNDGTPESQAQAVREDIPDTEIEEFLLSKTTEEFFAALTPGIFGMITYPNIFMDGTVIHEDGADALNDPASYNQVPVILGTNLEEQKLFLFFMIEQPIKYPFAYQAFTRVTSDLWKVGGVDSLATMMSAHGSQPAVYAYQFLYGAYRMFGYNAWPKDVNGINYALGIGASHTLEIPFFWGSHYWFVFNDLIFREDNRLGREALSDAMMAYVAQFARTGNPNGTGSSLTEWTPWSNTEDASKRILFDANDTDAIIEMSTE